MENSPKLMDGKNLHEFNIDVDGVGYFVEAEPYQFNNQVRYYISVNGRTRDVFVWDTERELFRALDDDAVILPDGLIRDISNKLLELAE